MNWWFELMRKLKSLFQGKLARREISNFLISKQRKKQKKRIECFISARATVMEAIVWHTQGSGHSDRHLLPDSGASTAGVQALSGRSRRRGCERAPRVRGHQSADARLPRRRNSRPHYRCDAPGVKKIGGEQTRSPSKLDTSGSIVGSGFAGFDPERFCDF